MKYFAKYLPVEGEIREGDHWVHPNGAILPWTKTYVDGPIATLNPKKAQLFLCSRDIHAGDRYLTEPDLSKERICEDDSYNFDHCLKIIGPISSEATWVKEGDEFEEEDAKEEDIFNDLGHISGCYYMIKGPCGHFH